MSCATYCCASCFLRSILQASFQQEIKSSCRTTNNRTQGGSHMKRVLRFVTVALLAVVGSCTMQAQSNPLVGTWKLNVTKSKFDPGPAPKSLTRTVEAQGDGVKYTFAGVAADGKPISEEIRASGRQQKSPREFSARGTHAACSTRPASEWPAEPSPARSQKSSVPS